MEHAADLRAEVDQRRALLLAEVALLRHAHRHQERVNFTFGADARGDEYRLMARALGVVDRFGEARIVGGHGRVHRRLGAGDESDDAFCGRAFAPVVFRLRPHLARLRVVEQDRPACDGHEFGDPCRRISAALVALD